MTATVADKLSKAGTNWTPSTAPVAFLGIPTPSDLAATIVKVVLIGTGVAAGAGLILLGLNKATG